MDTTTRPTELPATPCSPLPDLFLRLGEIQSYICLERTWLRSSMIASDTKIVWKCRCAAPGNFEAVGDTPEEAIWKALELHARIVSANAKCPSTGATETDHEQ